MAGGIRGGKSYFSAMELLGRCYVDDGLFWIVGPDYEQAKAEFDYIHGALECLDMIDSVSMPERGSRRIVTRWGARIETKTSDDVRKLASFAPSGILMAEAAQQPHDVFLKLMERALEKHAWLVMSGTFETSLGWYADHFEQWQTFNPVGAKSFSLPTWSNTRVFPGGRKDPKILQLEASMPPDLFMERCGAVPVKPSGLVFKEFDPKTHVKRLEQQFASDGEPVEPVELAIDPGYGGAYAVLFVQVVKPTPESQPTRVHVLDEIYTRELIAQDVIPLVQANPLCRQVRSGVIDIAAKQHHANYSQIEIWQKHAPGISLRMNRVPVEEGINAIKLRLQRSADDGEPNLLFNSHLTISRTEAGLANGVLGELLSYKYRPFVEGRSESARPIKANDHAINALAYYLYDRFGPVIRRVPPSKYSYSRGRWAA